MKRRPYVSDLGKLVELTREHGRRIAREWGVLRSETSRVGIQFALGHCLLALESLKESASIRELADMLQLEPSAMSRTVEALKQKGWVDVEKSTDDARKRVFKLTSLGRKQARTLNDEVDKRVLAALSVLKPADRKKVVTGLTLYSDALRKTRR